jgi:glycosyltransferase involved in cell wall biosynthesis
MTIGIDASRANRDHKTGTEWYSYYIISWLVKLDLKNKYILYSDKPLSGGLLDLAKLPNVEVKILNWSLDFFWTQGRLSWEMLWHRPDILFVPAHALPIIHPRHSIVTIHDIGFAREDKLYDHCQIGPENKKGRGFLNFLVRLFTLGKYSANACDYLEWSTRYSLKHAEKIITVSNFSKQEILDVYKIQPEKITVIHNGYNNLLYKKIEDKKKTKEVLEKYNLNFPFLLYIGRLDKKKNTPALIEAFSIVKSKHKDVAHKLVLIGAANYGYDEINYMIEEFNLDQEVVLPGWIAEEDLPYIYSAATAFIFPSLYEGFGIPILEAMACGTAVAASNVASIPEVAGGAALFFDPHDVNSMAEAMADIIFSNQLREDLIKKGSVVVKKYSWEKSAQETLEQLVMKN